MTTAKHSKKYYQSQIDKGFTQIKVWVPRDRPDVVKSIRALVKKFCK